MLPAKCRRGPACHIRKERRARRTCRSLLRRVESKFEKSAADEPGSARASFETFLEESIRHMHNRRNSVHALRAIAGTDNCWMNDADRSTTRPAQAPANPSMSDSLQSENPMTKPWSVYRAR